MRWVQNGVAKWDWGWDDERDARSRIARATRHAVKGPYLEQFGYDDLDRPLHVIFPDFAECIEYRDHLIVSSTCGASDTTQTFETDDAGRLLTNGQFEYPIHGRWTYDDAGRVREMTWDNPQETWSQTWSYDRGLLASSTETVTTATKSARCDEAWSYVASRTTLTMSVSTTGWGIPAPASCTYAFEPKGLRSVHCDDQDPDGTWTFEHLEDGTVVQRWTNTRVDPPYVEEWRMSAGCEWPPTRENLVQALVHPRGPRAPGRVDFDDEMFHRSLPRPDSGCFDTWGDE